jgi:hypothetical protein
MIENPAWATTTRATLERYAEPLVRQIAHRLIKPRNQWPVADLIDRIVATLENAPAIDRRVKDLSPASRKLLALMAFSRQPVWRLSNLLSMLAALGHAEGTTPVEELFLEGLLYPVMAPDAPKLRTFVDWFGQATATQFSVYAPPVITGRTRVVDLGLPELASAKSARDDARTADGLEWLLRLAVAWQQVTQTPLRMTQQRDFFKRDLTRLRGDPLLNAPMVDETGTIPDVGLASVAWAFQTGLLRDNESELHAGDFPKSWSEGIWATLDELWTALPNLESWDPLNGWDAARSTPNPFPSTYLLVLLILARQPERRWIQPADIDQWLREHHPLWQSRNEIQASPAGAALSVLYQLRLTESAAAVQGLPLARLSPFGRALVRGEYPPSPPEYRQTLMVQANFEVLAFRQGLSPALIADLSRFANWKTLGTACMFELNSDCVYRGLEAGQSYADIVRLLTQHGTRPVPDNVNEALRTWSNKRDRIMVYGNATLIEFATPADLDEAVARGLIEAKISDRLGLVHNENSLDYRHFRLTGTRDYGAKPDPCVTVADDGVTLIVDSGRSDLLLDTELARLAEPLDANGKERRFRLTRRSLARGLSSGWTVQDLDEWLILRAGQPLSPAARLLMTGDAGGQFMLRRCLVLFAPTAGVADGLMQLPQTRPLIRQRLGPLALLVDEGEVARLSEQLRELGQSFNEEMAPISDNAP